PQLYSSFFTTPPTPATSTLSLHDALPISLRPRNVLRRMNQPRSTAASQTKVMSDRPYEAPMLLTREKSSVFPKSRNMGCTRLMRSEEHTSELQSRENLVCRLLLEKKKKKK